MSNNKFPGWNRDSYKSSDAWFCCDRCGTRGRRSRMFTEWTGLKVHGDCLDPYPPDMIPYNLYPEGIPFIDARPDKGLPDLLTDSTSLVPIQGGFTTTTILPAEPGLLSPQNILSPINDDPNSLRPIRTGPIFPKDAY